jgi:MoaA/NifB/PqqE/SkfB family radical SAM enzyme
VGSSINYGAIVAKSYNQNLLSSVLVELTYRCNLDCFFCYNDLGLKGKPVSTERYLELWQELAEMQVFTLTLSGGEPLAHPDFVELGRGARDLGFVVRVKSNGHALSPSYSQQIKDEIDPFMVDVSIHGSTAEVHDRQTRVPGSFDRLMANIEGARKAGLRLKANTTLTSWNEHEIEGIFALAESLDLGLSISPTVSPKDDGDTEPLSIRPSDEAVQRMFRALEASKPSAPAELLSDPGEAAPTTSKNCGAGASTLVIDPFGDVFPCVQWRRSIGNVHQSTIGEIWSGSAVEEIRSLNEQAESLKDTRQGFARLANHCMGLSELKTGDPLAVDPVSVLEAEAKAAVKGGGGLLPVIQ